MHSLPERAIGKYLEHAAYASVSKGTRRFGLAICICPQHCPVDSVDMVLCLVERILDAQDI